MIAALALIVLACAAPWAFGAVEPLWWGTACAACLVVATAWFAWRAAQSADTRSLPPRAGRLAAALVGLTLVGLVPIPPAVRFVVSPGTAAVLADADPAGADAWRPISIDPHATLAAAVLAAACAAAFVIVTHAARDEARARLLRAVVLAGGVALATFGLAQRAIRYDPQAIYWTVRLPDVATPFGPYVNRNHFAGVMLLFAGTAAGSFAHGLAAGRRAGAAIAGAAGAVILVALAATASRGALVGLAAGALFLLVASPARGRIGLRTVACVALGIAAVATALHVLGLFGDLAGRFHLEPAGRERNRFAVQWDAVCVFAKNPIFGTGAGTFASAYPPFQTVDDVRFFSSAHSDWAQFLMETGVLGLAFAVAAGREFVARLRDAGADESPRRWHVIGPAAGCIALCVHGFFETNLHVPANALLFTVTLSLACGASLRRDV